MLYHFPMHLYATTSTLAILLEIILGGNFMGKLNLIWSACSNNGGYNVLEKPLERIFCDILRHKEKFMQNFFNDVLKATKISPEEIKTAKVDIEEKGIDLFIQTDRQIIPIELKIDACDQDKQCHRYLQTAREINKNVPARLYYLTKDKENRKPSPESLNGEKIFDNDLNSVGNEEGVILISYKDEILNWLEDCSRD